MSFIKCVRRNRLPLWLLGGLLAAPLAAAAPQGQTPAQTAPEIATGQVAGTTLTVTPKIGYYEKAVLRVGGPAHYALTKRFEANAPISADLLNEGQQLDDSREAGEDDNALGALPSGHYNYEVVFNASSTGRQVHAGSFRIE